MFKAIKKLFGRGGKKGKKEERQVLILNEEVKDADVWSVDEEEMEQRPDCKEDRVQARFSEEYDGVGNVYLVVKPPEVWYPGHHTDDYGWCEESGYNTKKFQLIWEWIQTKDDGWYPYEEDEEFDFFNEDQKKKDPKPRLSCGENRGVQIKERTGQWLEKASKEKFPEIHYDMIGFERNWKDFDDYEWTVPDDEVRIGLRLTKEEENEEDFCEWNSANY
ncbi:uncharacterized protein [Parasteatoda tepidariorum]|uniref:uncharacterized protein n=1 Tax=Parasteatoda tepidariorum TaxID=114398 RepID=UPI001C71D8B9|nr:uncharacterized protein LOC107446513 [Parasteatoda tepidariorum]